MLLLLTILYAFSTMDSPRTAARDPCVVAASRRRLWEAGPLPRYSSHRVAPCWGSCPRLVRATGTRAVLRGVCRHDRRHQHPGLVGTAPRWVFRPVNDNLPQRCGAERTTAGTR